MREGTPSRVTAADGPYGEFYDFYSVSPENFGYHLVQQHLQSLSASWKDRLETVCPPHTL